MHVHVLAIRHRGFGRVGVLAVSAHPRDAAKELLGPDRFAVAEIETVSLPNILVVGLRALHGTLVEPAPGHID